MTLRVGIADHFGWAGRGHGLADHQVIDRRRVELIDPGVTPAPIHYESARLDVAAMQRDSDQRRTAFRLYERGRDVKCDLRL